MPILYNLDLKDYTEDAAVTKCAAVKVIVVSNHGLLLGNSFKQGFYEVPSIKIQPDLGGLGEHAVRLVRELLNIEIGAELPVNIGQAFYKRKAQGDSGTVVNELYNYYVIDLDCVDAVTAEWKTAGDSFCLVSFEDAFRDKENHPGLPELAYAETEAMKTAVEYVNGKCGNAARVVPAFTSVDEPYRDHIFNGPGIMGMDYIKMTDGQE